MILRRVIRNDEYLLALGADDFATWCRENDFDPAPFEQVAGRWYRVDRDSAGGRILKFHHGRAPGDKVR